MEELLTTPHVPAVIEAEQTHLQVPSRPEWIEPTVEYLLRKAVLCGACLEAESSKLMLALHEALTNSVIHGNLEISSDLKEQGGSAFAEALAARAADPRYAERVVDVEVRYNGAQCQWVLTDEGPGFDVERVLARLTAEDDPEAMLTCGRGILLMRAFLHELRYEAGGRRAILTYRKTTTGEKRCCRRVAAQEMVRVAPLRNDGSIAWDAAYEAVTRNVSAGGMAILQAQLGMASRVVLGINHGGEIVYVPAEVRHWRVVGDNEVELGCRFQAPAAPPAEHAPTEMAQVVEAIDAFCDRYQSQKVSDERRAHPRVPYTGRVEIRVAADSTPQYGFARDLSRGGIAFITKTALPLERVLLEVPLGPDHAALCVRARVLRCVRVMEGFYDVGAQFLGLDS
jgi:anti-sigma regulatory factor (Ser/Thr protein kinase)